jgi:hypothetical protein
MQTNLTILDGIVALLLGIIGSIIANYLFYGAPKWFDKISEYWAKRSKVAAESKISKLRKELILIDEFSSDPTRFLAWMVTQSAYYTGHYTNNVIIIVALGTFYILFSLSSKPVFLVLSFMSMAYLVIPFITSTFALNKVRNFSDLKTRRAYIEAQIARLRVRSEKKD